MTRRLPLVILVVLGLGAGCGSEGPEAGGGTPSVPFEPTHPSVSMPVEPVPMEPAPPKGLPPAVQETRERIAAAALAEDYEALGELIPADGFTYSYGSPAAGGAVGYWRDLEATEEPLGTMAGLLTLPHTRVGGIYVWPWAYDKNPANLTDEEKEALAGAGAATPAQLEQMAEFGHYLGWRLGIRRDGTWMFFVAGD